MNIKFKTLVVAGLVGMLSLVAAKSESYEIGQFDVSLATEVKFAIPGNEGQPIYGWTVINEVDVDWKKFTLETDLMYFGTRSWSKQVVPEENTTSIYQHRHAVKTALYYHITKKLKVGAEMYHPFNRTTKKREDGWNQESYEAHTVVKYEWF